MAGTGHRSKAAKLTLPFYNTLKYDDIDDVIAALRKVITGNVKAAH